MKDLTGYLEKIIKSSPSLPYWNIEVIRSGKKNSWNYIDGVMLSSLIELYKVTGEKKYLDFVIKYTGYYINDDGSIKGYDRSKYSTDDICESKVLFDLYEFTGDEKYEKAIKYTYGQIESQPRTKEGNFIHKGIYHDQVWLDGLYMAQPFYTRYIKAYLKEDYSDVINQFKNVRKIMFDEKAGLYYHGYDSSKTLFWADKKTGLSKNFWLRASGWFTVSLIDCIGYMGKDKGAELIPIFKEAVDGLLKYRDEETDMFFQLPALKGLKGNYPEMSGSAMIAYALLKGVRLGVLDESYRELGLKVFNGVEKNCLTLSPDGDLNIKGICLVAGLGPEDNLRRDGTTEYYLSEPVVENDAKGTAPYIMAYTEAIRLQ